MKGCEEIAQKVSDQILECRAQFANTTESNLHLKGYHRDSYLIKANFPRFATGEGKAVITESIRGYDLFIISDCFNYNVTYKMYNLKDANGEPLQVPMSPDDHFADIKRIISAISGKAARISVIMPMLYESRQHRRTARESLDCAFMLHELTQLGVENIMTFDAHDDRVRNAIPLEGFDNLMPTYQMFKAFMKNEKDIDIKNTVIVSPDEGALGRGMYYSSVLGIPLAMFYKRRDYTIVKDGRNPIVAHEYLGDDVAGKDIIVVDDIISSGDSFLHILDKLKGMGAKRIFGFFTFGLFCNGFETIDDYAKRNMFDRIYATNAVYNSDNALSRDWFIEVNVMKYAAYYIEALNINRSVSVLMDPIKKMHALCEKYNIELPKSL
jgi:ribose-phosphate pyrophosphokinase